MAVFKCKMCGATLDIKKDENIVECGYCGTKQTVPVIKTKEIEELYDRANYFFHNNEYDKAASIYENISTENPYDPESYFMLALCKYGIEYVDDPVSKKKVPTLHRLHYDSIFNDINYKKAIKHADSTQKILYEKEAKYIDEVRNKILDISKKEKPYDVFICYKETDEKGQRTEDSVLAMEIYNELNKEGLKVFFSRVTLESKLGIDYEPYIFAALNSAKVMVVVGTKPEYINSPWVRNEWTRFLDRINKSKTSKKNTDNCYIVPAYKGMSPYALPNEFSSVQAQDMSKVGAIQDLIHGIKKLINKSEETTVIEIKTNKKTKYGIVSVLGIFIVGIILTIIILKTTKVKNEVFIRNTSYSINKQYEEIIFEGISDFNENDIIQLKKIQGISNLFFKDCVLENLNFLYELPNVKGVEFNSKTKILDLSINNIAENIISFNYDYSSSSDEWDDLSLLIKMPNLINVCVPICDDLTFLASLKRLEKLELRSQKNSIIDGFQWSKGLENVKILKLAKANSTIKYVGEDCFKELNNLKNIEELNITGTIGTEKSQLLRQKDIDYISELSTLKNLRINFGGNGNAKDGYLSLNNLQKIKGLQSIYLYTRNKFDLTGLNNLTELKEITVQSTYSDIYNNDLNCLNNSKSLESLVFRINTGYGNRTFDLKGLETLTNLKTLKIYAYDSNKVTILNENLAKDNIRLEYALEEKQMVN